MIDNYISKKILTIGPDKNGKGGMAAVLNIYEKDIYSPFYFIKTHDGGNILKKILTFFKAVILIPFVIIRKKINIVHIHGTSKGSFIRKRFLVYCLKLFGVSIVFHLHSGEFAIFSKQYGYDRIRKTFNKCSKVIVLSKQWETFLKTEIKFDNTVIINNPIPEPKIEKTSKSNVLRLLYLGAIRDEKGIFDLLQLIKEKKSYYENKIILHIGGFGETDRLEKYISDNQITSIVNFEGWVEKEKKERLFNECDLFILPSHFEGMPISILEGMSYHKPIIATCVGGIPEVVKNGLNGYLFEPGDLNALQIIIDRFINDRSQLERMGDSSKEMIKLYFPNEVEKQLEALYKSILYASKETLEKKSE